LVPEGDLANRRSKSMMSDKILSKIIDLKIKFNAKNLQKIKIKNPTNRGVHEIVIHNEEESPPKSPLYSPKFGSSKKSAMQLELERKVNSVVSHFKQIKL
jgi:hypothetical protein